MGLLLGALDEPFPGRVDPLAGAVGVLPLGDGPALADVLVEGLCASRGRGALGFVVCLRVGAAAASRGVVRGCCVLGARVGSLPLSRASGNVGVSHCSICSASVAWVVCPALQPSHALQRVRGVRWEGRNSPSKNTLALAEASASAAKSRVIMFAVVRCNTGVAPCATAVCDAQTSTRRGWGSLEVGCPRPCTRGEGWVW